MDPVAAKSAAAEHITERGGRLMPFELGVAFGTCVGTRPVGPAIFAGVLAIAVAATSVAIVGATAIVTAATGVRVVIAVVVVQRRGPSFPASVCAMLTRTLGWRTLVE
jgi:hypothetical protein